MTNEETNDSPLTPDPSPLPHPSTLTTHQKELEVALEAARLAGKLILEHYAHFEVIPNAPADISTDTDRASQEAILQYLHKAFPNDALRAEESTETLKKAPSQGPRAWVVDPIDGTRGFARKNGEFSVMIAFVEDDKPVVGVVLEPTKELLTYAVAGGGCWRQDTRSSPAACKVTMVRDLSKATITQSHSRDPNKPSAYIQALRPLRVIETYSAGIKLAQVARGEADIYLNTYDACHDWDICAGQVLVEEVGGHVTNLRGVSPRYFQPGAVQSGGLLASNGLLHESALAAIRDIDVKS
jgi:3'(2'), 5'-bisphosphate nucleotidase